MEKLAEALKTMGLSDKEASIYIALLQSGKSSLSDIAKDARIRRTTVYQHVHSLLRRGIISKTLKGKRILYLPEDPKKVLTTFEKGKMSFMEQAPYMEHLYRSARHKPHAQLYEGLEGITHVLQEIGASFAPIDAFFSPEKFFNVVPKKITDDFLQGIQKNENVLRDLVEFDSLGQDFVKSVKKEGSPFHKVKLLPKDFSVSVDVLVTKDTVAMISFDHMVALLVENPEIAKFHRSTHNFFWNNLV